MGWEGRKFIANLNADAFAPDEALSKVTRAPLDAKALT
jgi:hypothetical protein